MNTLGDGQLLNENDVKCELFEYLVYTSKTWEPEEKFVALYSASLKDYSHERVDGEKVIKVEDLAEISHESIIHGCPLCDVRLPKEYPLLAHIKLCHRKPQHQGHTCELCKREFSSRSNLKSHFKLHTRENRFLCKECNQSFKKRGQLREHKLAKHGEKMYKCNQCLKQFSNRGKFNCHVTKCKVGEVLADSVGIERESDVTNRSSFQPCPLCDVRLLHGDSLLSHIKKCHRNPHSQGHVCEICKRRFSSRSNLASHVKIHERDEPHKCKLCRRGFYRKSHLKEHIISQHGDDSDEVYKCRKCSRQFNDRSNFNRHMKIHAYICETCKKQASVSNNVNVRVHTGEIPYTCDLCNKQFSQRSCLSAHARDDDTLYQTS